MNACSKSAQQLRDEMCQVRSHFDDEVDQFIENTRVLMDWHYYVRSAPMFCMGAAAVVGYLLVPSRARYVKPDASQLAELAKNRQFVLSEPSEVKPKKSVSASLAGIAGSFLLRTATAAATQHLKQLVGQSAAAGFRRHPSREVPSNDHD